MCMRRNYSGGSLGFSISKYSGHKFLKLSSLICHARTKCNNASPKTELSPASQPDEGFTFSRPSMLDLSPDHYFSNSGCKKSQWPTVWGKPFSIVTNSLANKIPSPISSAVILPVEPEAPKSPRAKRRQSSTPEDSSSKRPRLSHDGSTGSPSAARESPTAESIKQESSTKQEPGEKAKDLEQERRKSSVQEEKKRGQRLFGGLLSTLSQSTPNGQQKRRLEIEKRQAEKAQQQKHDDELRRAEKLANLKKIRKVEQIKFDEESVSHAKGSIWRTLLISGVQMRVRHSNMLAMANFLCTKTEPKLVCIKSPPLFTNTDNFSVLQALGTASTRRRPYQNTNRRS